MFDSVQEYDNAISATGIQPVPFEVLGQLYPQFEKHAHNAFELFMTLQNRSVRSTSYDGVFSSYVNRQSQGMWCAWVEALLFVPGLSKLSARDAEKEMALFLVYAKAIGYDVSADAVRSEACDTELALHWLAWTEALKFGFAL